MAVNGGVGTGKSALVVAITKALLNVKAAIKTEKEQAKLSLVAKVHSI